MSKVIKIFGSVFLFILLIIAINYCIQIFRFYKNTNIIYSGKDYCDSVTEDLSLPTDINNHSIEWQSSNDFVITTQGVVIRPDKNNTVVKLTAKVKLFLFSYKKTFNLKVLSDSRTLSDEKYSQLTLDDLKIMSDSNNVPLEYGYDSSGTKIESFFGHLSDTVITNPKDAYIVIYQLKNLLGIQDPRTELKLVWVNYNDDGNQYIFDQMYKGILVYDVAFTLCTNKQGFAESIESSYMDIRLKKPDIGLSKGELKDVIESEYGKKIKIDSISDITIVSFDKYKEHPAYGYLVTVHGGEIIEQIAFVDFKKNVTIVEATVPCF